MADCGEWKKGTAPDGKRFFGPCGRPATDEYNIHTMLAPKWAEWKPVCTIHRRVIVKHYHMDTRPIKDGA